MPEVSVESLTIKNFGPYHGEHVFKFGNLDGRCGILIGGKNGAGKTHLLRALYLAVVGERGVVDLKKVDPGSDATRFIFEKSLNRKAELKGENTVKLSVVVSQRDERGGGTRKVSLMREIRHRQNSPPSWRSTAKKSDDNTEITDEDVIQKLRDSFLPRHLARFFFFDAERSQSLHLGQQDIVEGISRILGLWTYSELETDLRQLVQTKIPKTYSSPSAADAATKLADLSADVLRAEGHLKARQSEQRSAVRDFGEAEAELLKIEDELKAIGAVDPSELQQFHDQSTEITKSKADMEAQLKEAWEAAMPIALLGDYRKELHSYLVREEKRRDWESSRAAVEPKIPQVKDDVFENVPPEFALKDDFQAFYLERLEKALYRLFHPPPEGMSDSAYAAERNDVSAQIRARLASHGASLRNIAELCTNVERLDAKLREIDQSLKRLQQNSAALARGNELHGQRGEYTEKRNQFSKRLSELSSEIKLLEEKITELKREETNQRELAEKVEKGQSLAALAARYREAAGDIRDRAAIQLREQIANRVGELWIDFTERGREFASMEFDKLWNCILRRRDGSKVSWDEINASAGQRQVRMLAFYEALRRLAKLIPPLVVDTPLGRLDREVKESVLDQLYLTGHQSIILTTNSEIEPDGPLFNRVKDRIARAYTLHPHGEKDSQDYEVRVTNDYFGSDV